METKPDLPIDPIVFPEGAEAWLTEHGNPDIASMDEVELSRFISRLRRIAEIHPHLVEAILERLFDIPSAGIISAASREETYFICLGQFVINPLRIAPELILKGLECLDEAEQKRFQRVVKHAEKKLEAQYPYLYSLHLRKQKSKQVNGRPSPFGDRGREAVMLKEIHELEKREGIQLTQGDVLLIDQCRLRGDLPPEMVEFAVKKESEGNLSVAVDLLDILFKTFKKRSEDERMDFLIHMRRVFTDSFLSKMEDSEEMIQHWKALHDLELQMGLLTHDWYKQHPLTKRLKRISAMQELQDRAGSLSSLVWGYKGQVLEVVN